MLRAPPFAYSLPTCFTFSAYVVPKDQVGIKNWNNKVRFVGPLLGKAIKRLVKLGLGVVQWTVSKSVT